jgi:hypothetical protein
MSPLPLFHSPATVLQQEKQMHRIHTRSASECRGLGWLAGGQAMMAALAKQGRQRT